MNSRPAWALAVWCPALIGIAVLVVSCAQLQQSMQEQKDNRLKREIDLSRFQHFATIAGGGEKAVGEFHFSVS